MCPVGSDREHPVDVRVLAATSSDLHALMRAARFREDLYFRLAELVCELPLRHERAEDIPALARALLYKTSRRGFPEGVKALADALWEDPGHGTFI